MPAAKTGMPCGTPVVFIADDYAELASGASSLVLNLTCQARATYRTVAACFECGVDLAVAHSQATVVEAQYFDLVIGAAEPVFNRDLVAVAAGDNQIVARLGEAQARQGDVALEFDGIGVARIAAVFDGVVAIAFAEHISVAAGAAVQVVITVAAVEDIATGVAIQAICIVAAEEVVVTVAAVQAVTTTAANQDIVAVAAVQHVVAHTAVQIVVTVAAIQNVCAVAAVEFVVTAFAIQGIATVTAINGVVAVTAIQGVVAAFAVNDVVGGVANDDIVQIVAGQRQCSIAGGSQVFYVGAQSVVDGRNYSVVTLPQAFHYLITLIVYHIGIVANAANHDVGAFAAIQIVVAGQALQRVIAVAAE